MSCIRPARHLDGVEQVTSCPVRFPLVIPLPPPPHNSQTQRSLFASSGLCRNRVSMASPRECGHWSLAMIAALSARRPLMALATALMAL